ncbi:hypothetical protein MMC30_008123 [Trapelia coarctata]|nr:hypothetical protein [Trapelia coarctata]
MTQNWEDVKVEDFSWVDKQGFISSFAGVNLTEEQVMWRLVALLPGFDLEAPNLQYKVRPIVEDPEPKPCRYQDKKHPPSEMPAAEMRAHLQLGEKKWKELREAFRLECKKSIATTKKGMDGKAWRDLVKTFIRNTPHLHQLVGQAPAKTPEEMMKNRVAAVEKMCRVVCAQQHRRETKAEKERKSRPGYVPTPCATPPNWDNYYKATPPPTAGRAPPLSPSPGPPRTPYAGDNDTHFLASSTPGPAPPIYLGSSETTPRPSPTPSDEIAYDGGSETSTVVPHWAAPEVSPAATPAPTLAPSDAATPDTTASEEMEGVSATLERFLTTTSDEMEGVSDAGSDWIDHVINEAWGLGSHTDGDADMDTMKLD